MKEKLDHKAEEKKQQLKEEMDGFGDEGGAEEIIDEEELMMLREMKDLKKGYRENFDKLKNIKVDANDL